MHTHTQANDLSANYARRNSILAWVLLSTIICLKQRLNETFKTSVFCGRNQFERLVQYQNIAKAVIASKVVANLMQKNEWKLKILTNTAKLPANPLMISLLAMISTALGCGVMPPGQDDEKKTLYHIADMTNRRWKLINTDQIRYI
ncbi:hypothetical protein KIN20_027664 [Parelaphostrongylus tenuis]|uniref:Uncharacterized protein n=1 Tax=Parelaphostrongylus tenuis TaxID=148309 RepID=A0AAD5QZW6_PARTN|nr:hypothetical protein KIN20_027664 [Parelaphostrongylus tenuis]